ncbi:hypothetical protein [Tolypothrix sp. FACHB-123]|nr:hypothetical protein [Tolypothrix sp. FACHB-123]
MRVVAFAIDKLNLMALDRGGVANVGTILLGIDYTFCSFGGMP